MPPTTPPPAARSADAQVPLQLASVEDRPFEVLITGFGPFGKTIVNPSWSIASQLHDVTLYPPIPPPTPKRNIHIQSLNLPVVYANTLDVVPRIHGRSPVSPYAKREIDEKGPTDGAQGDGEQPYPEGYAPRLHHPLGGYDLVIHVGVGLNGGVRVEKQAHKEGYKKLDAFEREAPPSDYPPSEGGGFGKGYEEFEDVCRTTVDVDGLVAMLETRGCGPVSASTDPGRYLCDFTYYCSLAESRRAATASTTESTESGERDSTAGAQSKGGETQTLFIHVPQAGQPQTVEDGRKIVIQAVGWILWGR